MSRRLSRKPRNVARRRQRALLRAIRTSKMCQVERGEIIARALRAQTKELVRALLQPNPVLPL